MGRGNKEQEEEKKNTRNKALLHGFSLNTLPFKYARHRERERKRECVGNWNGGNGSGDMLHINTCEEKLSTGS